MIPPTTEDISNLLQPVSSTREYLLRGLHQAGTLLVLVVSEDNNNNFFKFFVDWKRWHYKNLRTITMDTAAGKQSSD